MARRKPMPLLQIHVSIAVINKAIKLVNQKLKSDEVSLVLPLQKACHYLHMIDRIGSLRRLYTSQPAG